MRNLILLALFPLLTLLSNSLVKLSSSSASFDPSVGPHTRRISHFKKPALTPAPSPNFQGPVAGPSNSTRPRHHRHHNRTHAISPSPSTGPGCSKECPDPLASTPIDSTCGCVLPVKVKFLFGLSLITILPVCFELEREIAEVTYLKQSQVVLTNARNDGPEKSTIDIDLVPLGEKFDDATAMRIYERLWYKKAPFNKTLFGDYEIASIIYPGLPSSPPSGTSSGPSGSAENQQFPVSVNYNNRSHKFNSRTVFFIIVSAIITLVVCFGVLSIFIRCRNIGRPSNAVGPFCTPLSKKRSGIGSLSSSTPESSKSASLVSPIPTSILSVKTFSLVELEKATDKFNSKRVLGEGGFGRVYHGVSEDGSEIAVKLLTRDIENRDREFVAEVEMLSRLHHRNLVKLLGICIEGRVRCLIYEVVPNGSVESHLHGADKVKGHLDWDTRLKIALGSARGLAYLHEDSNPRVIHRDFKASNVLLENDFTPKVSDFGLAREATEGSSHISTRVMGTFGYVAPEYAMTGHLLVKSDVYSYGVVLLELLSGRKPVDMSQPYGQESLVTWARPLLTTREGLQQLVDPTLAGTYEFDDMAKVAAIASMCVNQEVTYRPFMGEVVQALKLIYNDNCGSSHRASSALGSDPSDGSWSNGDGGTPGLNYVVPTSFMTMEYSPSPLGELTREVGSGQSIVGVGGGGGSLPVMQRNGSGSLRMGRSKSKIAFYRLKGSMSEHGLLSKSFWGEGNWYESSF